MALTDNLVEFWTLNDTLEGVNGNTLVSPDGLTHYVAGIIGKAWEVAAAANRVPILNPSQINPGDSDWTVNLWIYFNGFSDGGDVVQLTDGTASRMRVTANFFIGDEESPAAVNVRVRFSATIVFTTDLFDPYTVPSVAGWQHVLVRHAAGSPATIDVFVNGEKRTATTSTKLASWAAPRLQIGGGVSPHLSSSIDAVCWWSRALEDSEVAQLYNAGAGWEPSPPADNTPDAFAFTDVTDADPETLYTSDSETITGMDAGTAVSITGGEYRINGGAWTAAAGTIDPGDTLELRATSSAESEGVVTVTVTVGTVSVEWSITTRVIRTVDRSALTNRLFTSLPEAVLTAGQLIQ